MPSHLYDFTTALASLEPDYAQPPHGRSPLTRWLLRLEESIKFNFDAAVSSKTSKGCSAVVVRDYRRNPLGWNCKFFQGVRDPLVLEALACREVSLLANQKGYSKVIFKGDSLMMIQAISGHDISLSIEGLIKDIYTMLHLFLRPPSFTAFMKRIVQLTLLLQNPCVTRIFFIIHWLKIYIYIFLLYANLSCMLSTFQKKKKNQLDQDINKNDFDKTKTN